MGGPCVPARYTKPAHPTIEADQALKNSRGRANPVLDCLFGVRSRLRTTTAAALAGRTFVVPTGFTGSFGAESGRDSQNPGRQSDFRLCGLRCRRRRSLLDMRLRLLGRLLLRRLGLNMLLRRLRMLMLRHGHVRLIVIALVAAFVAVLGVALAIEILAVVVAAIIALAVILLTVVLLAILLTVRLAVLLFKTRIENTVIKIGVLEIVFRQNPVAGRPGVARHGQELFHQLLRVTAQTAVIAAVEIGVTATTAATAAATAAAAARTRFAAVTAALTALHIIVLFVHQNE